MQLFFGVVVYAIADLCKGLDNQGGIQVTEKHTSRQFEETAASGRSLVLGLVAWLLIVLLTADPLLGVVCLGDVTSAPLYWSAKVYDNM